jgi:hypothetical protein
LLASGFIIHERRFKEYGDNKDDISIEVRLHFADIKLFFNKRPSACRRLHY